MDKWEPKILPVDLARIGGGAWSGWQFSPWGRARDWRLIAPDGANYTAGELADVRRRQMDIDYLRARVALIDDAAALYIPRKDAAILREAATILDEHLPKARRRP